MKTTLKSSLARMAIPRFGRVVLHSFCIVRHPENLQWHWQGILRELGAAPVFARVVRTCLTLSGLIWLSFVSASQAAQPLLSMQRVSSGVRVSWPHTNFTYYFLEQASGLDDSWAPVDVMYDISDAGHSVTLPAEYQTRFFRLRTVLSSNSVIFVGQPSPSALVAYLNNNFIPKFWPQVQDNVKNQVIHRTHQQIKGEGLQMRLGGTAFNMNSLPVFQLRPDGNGIYARFPREGAYSFRTEIARHADNYPKLESTARVRGSFALGIDIFGTTTPISNPQATVDLAGDFGNVMDPIFNEERYAREISGSLQEHTGFLQPMRFDPATSGTVSSSNIALLFGQSGMEPRATIDIVLVADGFSQTDMSEFNAQASAIVTKLTQPDPNHVNEPFISYGHALRIWKISVVSTPGNSGERILTGYDDPITGTRKTAFSNLARLAGVGLRSQALGCDVMVVLSAIRRPDGALDESMRAVSAGDVVLLPISSNPVETATVLVHELGHTQLGGLADEYVEDSFSNVVYAALEPINPNIQIQKSAAQSKWAAWTNLVAAWDQPVKNFEFEGGYLFGGGIYRPSEHCKMRHADQEVPFCQVCRATLTRGIARQLGHRVVLDVSFSSPWTNSDRLSLQTSRASTYVLPACSGTDTVVDLRILGASLPKPWRITWTWTRGSTSQVLSTAADPTFAVRRGDRIRLVLSSDCFFLTAAERFPIYSVTFDFSALGPCPAVVPEAPENPYDVQYTKETFPPIPPSPNPITVRSLTATSFDVDGTRIKFEFEIQAIGMPFIGSDLIVTEFISAESRGQPVTGIVNIGSANFDRHFRVRATDETGRRSDWTLGPVIPRGW